MLGAFPTDHALLMQKKWGGGVAPLGQSIKSAAHGRACSGFVRRLINLLSPGGPRIPPCRPTCSPQNASFLRPFYTLFLPPFLRVLGLKTDSKMGSKSPQHAFQSFFHSRSRIHIHFAPKKHAMKPWKLSSRLDETLIFAFFVFQIKSQSCPPKFP